MPVIQCISSRGGFQFDPEIGVCYRLLDFMGFPGYRVGDDGSVWSCRKRVWREGVRGCRTVIGATWNKLGLNAGFNSPYYLLVTLSNETLKRKSCQFFVHVLVISAFHGLRPEPHIQCCHNNGNAKDNRLENLRWGTPKQNTEDMMAHGKHFRSAGELSGMHKLTEEEVLDIRKRYNKGGVTQYDLADEYDVKQSCIWSVIHRKTWKHI